MIDVRPRGNVLVEDRYTTQLAAGELLLVDFELRIQYLKKWTNEWHLERWPGD
jgi:hypothetical protein